MRPGDASLPPTLAVAASLPGIEIGTQLVLRAPSEAPAAREVAVEHSHGAAAAVTMRPLVPLPNGPTHFRAAARLRVELGGSLALAVGGHATREVRVRDLGLGGAGVEVDASADAVDAALAVDALVTLSVRAPALWDPLSLPARIAWMRPAEPGRARRGGLCFEELDPGKLLALFRVLTAAER
jgi:hypothetical protein